MLEDGAQGWRQCTHGRESRDVFVAFPARWQTSVQQEVRHLLEFAVFRKFLDGVPSVVESHAAESDCAYGTFVRVHAYKSAVYGRLRVVWRRRRRRVVFVVRHRGCCCGMRCG